MKSSGATAEAISKEFQSAIDRLGTEKPFRIVKVGERPIPIKPTDTYFLAMVMGVLMYQEEVDHEDAFRKAISLFAGISSEDERLSTAAFAAFKTCIETHQEAQIGDADSADQFLRKCQRYINKRLETLGEEPPQPKVNEPKSGIREIMNKRQEYLKNEKPILMIDLESHRAPLKPSDFQFLSLIMSFAIQHANFSEEDALEYSICTFVLLHDGNEQEKQDANITADNAFKWNFDRASTGHLQSDMAFQMYCGHLIKVHFGVAPKLE